MSERFLVPAVRVPAPGLHGTTGSDAIPVNVSTSISAASTSAVALTGSVATYWGKYITFAAVGTDVYIAFGASGMGAATTADWLITAGTNVSFWIEQATSVNAATAVPTTAGVVTHFRAIGAGTGTLNWCVSSS